MKGPGRGGLGEAEGQATRRREREYLLISVIALPPYAAVRSFGGRLPSSG